MDQKYDISMEFDRCYICFDDFPLNTIKNYDHEEKTCSCQVKCCDICSKLVKNLYVCLICRNKPNNTNPRIDEQSNNIILNHNTNLSIDEQINDIILFITYMVIMPIALLICMIVIIPIMSIISPLIVIYIIIIIYLKKCIHTRAFRGM